VTSHRLPYLSPLPLVYSFYSYCYINCERCHNFVPCLHCDPHSSFIHPYLCVPADQNTANRSPFVPEPPNPEGSNHSPPWISFSRSRILSYSTLYMRSCFQEAHRSLSSLMRHTPALRRSQPATSCRMRHGSMSHQHITSLLHHPNMPMRAPYLVTTGDDRH
jgi:hypothetical protein